MSAPRCVWPVATELGEGPCWASDALWFVDILAPAIHSYDPANGLRKSWPAPNQVSFILPSASGDFLVGLPDGIHTFSPSDGGFVFLCALEKHLPHNRTNDACVGPDHKLWIGTLDRTEKEANGSLWHWDGTEAPKCLDDGYVVSNGPAFSPDGNVFYFTNTLKRTVYAFDVDGTALRNKRPLVTIEEGAGWPDGTAVDAHGCLWIALWAAGIVRRYSPQGSLLESITIPCQHPTKVAFGGRNLSTMFITSARVALSAEQRRQAPLAGALFAVDVDVPGFSLPRFEARNSVMIR